MKTVTLTSQGQVTVPVWYRKKYPGKTKFNVTQEGKKLILEPAHDISDFAGALSHKAIKNKSIDEIIEIEHQTIEKAVVEDYIEKRTNE